MSDLTAPDTVPDLRPVFTDLFDLWVRQKHGRSLSGLAQALRPHGARLTRHTLSRFVAREGRETRSTRTTRQPPMWLLLHLCKQTGSWLELRPDGIRLVVCEPGPATQG